MAGCTASPAQMASRRLGSSSPSASGTPHGRPTRATRIKYGYPRRTKLRLDGQTARRYKQRHYLKARGYILGAPNEWVAYYDENTRRSKLYENRRPGDKHFAHWDFLPASELKK